MQIIRRTFLLIFSMCVGLKLVAQVNLQTGSANFSVPIFNWQDYRSSLSGLVSLNYSSNNGLKVNDVASNVGQGWSMVAGGVITRMQVGEPDDQIGFNGSGASPELNRFPPGYLYATVPAANGCPTALAKYPLYRERNRVYSPPNTLSEDKQMDYFSFSFNGKSGMFAIDPQAGSGVAIGDSRIRIYFEHDMSLINRGIRTTISKFMIVDVDGMLYTFSRHGLTKVLRTEYCDVSLTNKLTQPKFEGGKVYYQNSFDDGSLHAPFIIGSWHLTKVEDRLSSRVIQLNYVDRNINTYAGADISYNDKNYAIISHKKSVTVSPDLTSIIYPDGHVVAFNYGSARADFDGGYSLSSVDVSYKGRTLSKHLLTTTYMIGNRYGSPTTAYQKRMARLCLKSIRKVGVDQKGDSPPYQFDYYLGSGVGDDVVPPRFHWAKDIWGYYNSANSKAFDNSVIYSNISYSGLNVNQARGLCFLRNNISGIDINPNPGLAKNGLLRQVIYPTGGTLGFLYEQNTGYLNGSYRSVGGVHVSSTTSTDGGYENDCDNPLITNYSYLLSDNSTTSLWGLESPRNNMTIQTYYSPESKNYKWSWSCPIFGCCYYVFMYPGILSLKQAVSLSDFQKFMEAAAPVLGILTVVSTIVDIVTLCLGPTPLALAAVIVDVIAGIITVVISCTHNYTQNYTSTVYYNSDLNSSSPLPSQFKRVEVKDAGGGNGKTVYEFTSSSDYALHSASNPSLSAKQRFLPWAYGLPKRISIFDASGNIVKETLHKYDSVSLIREVNLGVSCKCLVVKNSSQRHIDYENPAIYNNPSNFLTQSNDQIIVDLYKVYTGRLELAETRERIYKVGTGTFAETITNYGYDSYNYQVNKIQTIEPNGRSEIKRTIFLNNLIAGNYIYNIFPAIIWLSFNYTSIQVGSLLLTGNESLVNERVLYFGLLPNGQYKPVKSYEQRVQSPKAPGTFSYYHGADISQNSNYKLSEIFYYDAGGNLSGVEDEGGRSVTNFYDYDGRYITAAVINAHPKHDRSAVTSFETGNFNGWSYTGVSTFSSSSVTGDRSLILQTGHSLIASGLNTAKKYKLTFWATNGSNTVSPSAVLKVSSPTIAGFTYYEYELPLGAQGVEVSGNSLIDELRLYPINSRVRSVTYEYPLGKTSECDENNRITYFKYDDNGRLMFVLDENKNVLKAYEYNNVSKQDGCPKVYYSKLTYEWITKDNCGSNFVGTSVLYTVPASKYSSTISQEDADSKVEYEIMMNGQAYANSNGFCNMIYTNSAQSITLTCESCPQGYIGGSVTYTVPAGKYTAMNQAEANQLALAEIEANAYTYVNDPLNRICTLNTQPDWMWNEGATYCLTVNGQLPAHQFVEETDMNPNSSTYGQKRWSDIGPTNSCPSNTYFNASQSLIITKNNCLSGYYGTDVTYTVPPGIYSSTVSQADADNKAFNDILLNGQSYANANGTCLPVQNPCSNCYGEGYRCVYGMCEQGFQVFTNSYWDSSMGQYVCVYHYEYSDGIWSHDYFLYGYPCPY